MKKPWNVDAQQCRRTDFLGEIISIIRNVLNDKSGHESIPHMYVKFFDENEEHIGTLFLADALDALQNDIFYWPECGADITEYTDNDGDEQKRDLDLRDSFSIEIHYN